MKTKDIQDIQMLVARFLDGETTLEEERKLYAFFLHDDVPAELLKYQEMFRAYASIAPKKVVKRRMRPVWLRVAGIAAACLVAFLVIDYTLSVKDEPKPHEDTRIVKHAEPSRGEKQKDEKTVIDNPSVPSEVLAKKEEASLPKPVAEKSLPKLQVSQTDAEGTKEVQSVSVERSRTRVPADAALSATAVYASAETKTDSSYQAPARVNEFVAKLAAFHHVEEEILAGCQNDSTMRSAAYVFPDNDKVRLFDRLLQVACWYSYDSPGYQFTISQQQLLFTLEDPRLQRRYLWLAERVGGNRIILYATQSPTDVTVSSKCYQDFREKIIHTNQTSNL